MYGRENLYEVPELLTECPAYFKAEADAVMDRMEARIHELESTPHTDNSAVIATLQKRIAELESRQPKWHDISRPLYSENGKDYYDMPPESGEYQVVYVSPRGARVVATDTWDVDGNYWESATWPGAYTHWADLLPLPEHCIALS